MGFEDIDITKPTNGDIFLYNATTTDQPPDIVMEMEHADGASNRTGLSYKWFSTNPRLLRSGIGSTGSDIGEATKYQDANINYDPDATLNGLGWSEWGRTFTWKSARVGTQWIMAQFKDQQILGATTDSNLQTKLGNVTRNGIDGGKNTIIAQDINSMKIHVVGAVGIAYTVDSAYRITDGETVSISSPYKIGCMTAMIPTLSDGDSVEYNNSTDTSFDEVRYKLEDITNTTTLFDTSSTSTDTVNYFSKNPFVISGYTMSGITVDVSTTQTIDYKLTVSKDTSSRIINFSVNIV